MRNQRPSFIRQLHGAFGWRGDRLHVQRIERQGIETGITGPALSGLKLALCPVGVALIPGKPAGLKSNANGSLVGPLRREIAGLRDFCLGLGKGAFKPVDAGKLRQDASRLFELAL